MKWLSASGAPKTPTLRTFQTFRAFDFPSPKAICIADVCDDFYHDTPLFAEKSREIFCRHSFSHLLPFLFVKNTRPKI